MKDISQLHAFDGYDWKQVRLDNNTHALNVIDYEHHELHDGSAFTCHYNNDCTNTGEMTIIAFNTPNTTKWLHMIFQASSSAGSYMAVYENCDLDAGEGTTLTVYNRDRNSSTTSTITTVEVTPVAGSATSWTETQAASATLSTTTELWRWYMGAATAGADFHGESRATAEFILKQNTQYAFVVVSTSNDDNTHNIVLSWYEHTNQ